MKTISPEMERQLRLIDELDLEPIAFKLVHPDIDETGMSVEEADLVILKYRRFLKLCALYPELGIVPSKEIDKAWHTHILDTAKYADDCTTVFGFMLHHFPYFGLRGMEDLELLKLKSAETRALYKLHFGENMYDGSPVDNLDASIGTCHGGACDSNPCDNSVVSIGHSMERPRLARI